MKIRRAPTGWAALLALVCCASASAQTTPPPTIPGTTPPITGATTIVPAATPSDTLINLLRPVGAPHLGEAWGLATKLGVATAPFGAALGGFLIKLDPSTGLQVRTATTFGPAFAERALTNGEGKVSAGISFNSVTYDRSDDLEVDGLQVRSVTGGLPAQGRSGIANVTVSAKTVVIAGRMGVTDNFDIGMVVPVVTMTVDGTTTLRNGFGDTILFAQGSNVSKGSATSLDRQKPDSCRLAPANPTPAVALMGTVRLPTGDEKSLRGLGVTRTMISFIASGGQGRFRPHANVGYEWWSKGVSVISDDPQHASVTVRHQLAYAAGMELEAAPKVTVLLDLLGGQIFGAGKLGFATTTSGATSTEALVALSEGTRRLSLAPGMKVNLKGKILLSLNALIALRDGGLHTRVTPVASIEMNFDKHWHRMSVQTAADRPPARRRFPGAPDLGRACASFSDPTTSTSTSTSTTPRRLHDRDPPVGWWRGRRVTLGGTGVGDGLLVFCRATERRCSAVPVLVEFRRWWAGRWRVGVAHLRHDGRVHGECPCDGQPRHDSAGFHGCFGP